MNNVLYDIKTNEIVLLAGFTKSEITIHIKHLAWVEDFVIRIVIQSDYSIIDNKVNNQFR